MPGVFREKVIFDRGLIIILGRCLSETFYEKDLCVCARVRVYVSDSHDLFLMVNLHLCIFTFSYFLLPV